VQPFVFHLPTKIVFGSGKLAECGQEARRLGKRPLLLTGKTAMQKAGVLAKVTGMLKAVGCEALLFEKVEPNPRSETLDEAVALGIAEGCDFVIGLGGGSPMDSAKAVAAAMQVSAKGALVSVWEFTSGVGSARRSVDKALPILLVSSTAATGSEGNCAAVITKWATHEKAVLWDLGAFPTVSIVDPEVMLGLPMQNTRDGVVDMMLHVLEQTFNGDDKAPVQDRTVEGMVRGMMEGLDQVEANPQDLQARENLSWASVNALIAGGGPNFGRTGAFTVHHLEHAVSGYTDISHGHGLATLWPRYMRVILEKKAAKIAAMGVNIFGVQAGDSAAPKTLDAIDAWLRRHELWFHLKDFGVDEPMISKMAADAIRLSGGGRDFLSAPVPLTQEKCEAIYRAAI
jgi:alcohol dehydrogenase YqhD (iron-dependent ADH family)